MQTNQTIQTGDRVAVVFYGEKRTGTVQRTGKSTIVWVKLDGGFLNWFHRESLVKIS